MSLNPVYHPVHSISTCGWWLQIEYKKRETERQLEQKLKSYAHKVEMEEKEAWQELECTPPYGPAADVLWGGLASMPDVTVDMTMPRADYLETLMPRKSCSSVCACGWI